jgi:hypothetical protein
MSAKLPPAPPAPDDHVAGLRLLTHGETCDTRGCPALAFSRVVILRDGEKVGAELHFCGHHFRENELVLLLMKSAGTASYLDETTFIGVTS